MPVLYHGKKCSLLRGVMWAAAPGVAVGLACAKCRAAEPAKNGGAPAARPPKARVVPAADTSPALPVSPKEEAYRERDRLKLLQEITASPPPLAPSTSNVSPG